MDSINRLVEKAVMKCLIHELGHVRFRPECTDTTKGDFVEVQTVQDTKENRQCKRQ